MTVWHCSSCDATWIGDAGTVDGRTLELTEIGRQIREHVLDVGHPVVLVYPRTRPARPPTPLPRPPILARRNRRAPRRRIAS